MTCSGQVHCPHFQHVFLMIPHCYFLSISCVLPLNLSPLSACVCTDARVASRDCNPEKKGLCLLQLWLGTLCRSSPHMLGFRLLFSCVRSHSHWEFTCVTTLSFRKLFAITSEPTPLNMWNILDFFKHLFVRDFPTCSHVLTHATFSPAYTNLNSNLLCYSS